MSVGSEFLRTIQESDLAMRAGNIDSRNFLLIHGTADTLVHQQHSLVLTKALTDQSIGFRHQVYIHIFFKTLFNIKNLTHSFYIRFTPMKIIT